MKNIKWIYRGIIFLMLFSTCISAWSQVKINLGPDINFWKGENSTKTFNVISIDTIIDAPNTYNFFWLLENNGSYDVLNSGIINDLNSIPSIELDLSNFNDTTELRLVIQDTSFSVNLIGKTQLNLLIPKVNLSSTTICSGTQINMTFEYSYDASKRPYLISLLYNDSNKSNYLQPLVGTDNWMEINSLNYLPPNVDLDRYIADTTNFILKIKDNTGFIQIGGNQQFITYPNRKPALPLFTFLCPSATTLSLDLNNTYFGDNNFVTKWYQINNDQYQEIATSVNSVSTQVTQIGKYIASLKLLGPDSLNCISFSNAIEIIKPISSLQIITDRQILMGPNDSIELKLDSIQQMSYSQFLNIQWFKDSNPIVGNYSNSYYAKEAGDYYAVILEMCEKTSSSNTISLIQQYKKPTLVDNITIDNELITIYPNPINIEFNIKFTGQDYFNKELNLKVTNENGQLLKSTTFKVRENNNFSIDEKNGSSSAIVSLESGNNIIFRKKMVLLKQN